VSPFEEPAKYASSTPSEDDQLATWPEQRRHERYDIDTELTARLLPDEKELMHGHSLDISVAGIAGVFVTGWELGARVLLEFFIPVTKEQLRVQAIVRNRSGYRYGFEFANLSGRERALIEKTCRVLALLE
jgi:PilZ domain